MDLPSTSPRISKNNYTVRHLSLGKDKIIIKKITTREQKTFFINIAFIKASVCFVFKFCLNLER